jgi:signal transduction histidine kinase
MERLDEIRVRLAGISDPARLLQGIFAYAPFGLQVYRSDGVCLLTNKAFRDIFGSEPPPEYNVLRDEVAERQGLLGLVKQAFAGEMVQTPTFWYDPRELQQVHVTEGRRVAISLTMLPLLDSSGAVEHVALVVKDETEETLARERAEAARANAEELAAQLTEQVRIRQDFLSIAGHELKTPLTSVLLNLYAVGQSLAEGPLGNDPLLAKRWRTLTRQLQRLESLVDQLLDVSRITAGKLMLSPEPLDLGEVVREVADRFAESACRIDVRVSGAVEGIWDRMRVEQILTNLIANAVKYGLGRPITIDVGVDDPAGKRAISIAVHDQGIGIAQAEKARIFDRFEQAGSRNHVGGLGLGLWIVGQIVEAMGGSISVDSEPERGSTFTVRLPPAQ